MGLHIIWTSKPRRYQPPLSNAEELFCVLLAAIATFVFAAYIFIQNDGNWDDLKRMFSRQTIPGPQTPENPL